MNEPEWVVLGSPTVGSDGYAIWASTDLSYGELSMERSNPQYEIKVGLRKYVVVTGQSYADCWSKLAEVWDPDRATGERQQIEARRAVGGER